MVGCEPGPPGDVDDMAAGLSGPVRAAVDEAVPLVESLVADLLSRGGSVFPTGGRIMSD